jgi:formylglycine-generating enzyme required for sulfatase activity
LKLIETAMNDCKALSFAAALLMMAMSSSGQALKPHSDNETLPGPTDPGKRDAWRKEMLDWRSAERTRINYDGREYSRPELQWTQRSFIQPQTMVEDRYFYDPVAGRYTVDRYLDDVQERYGGIDSILLWPVYPDIGIDNRNQHDLLRAMPGGLAGLKQVVADFHRRGVKVFFPVMPWDTGTRDEKLSLAEAAARDMKEIGADGINGDTLNGIGREYRDASDATGHVLALEPENKMDDPAVLAWNNMSWGYWTYWTNQVPLVSRYKWVEPRHMVNICERWARDRTNGLQAAFFNGVGYVPWENVWGIWNGLTPRDAHALRRIATIERAVADLLVSPDWQPHVASEQLRVHASLFPAAGQRLWFLVNRGPYNIDGIQLAVPAKPGERFYDLWHGVELRPEPADKSVRLAFEIEGGGFGAVLAVDDAHRPAYLDKLLAASALLAKTRLGSLSTKWKALPQQMVANAPTRPATNAPEGMIRIPGGRYRFKVSGVEIEGDDGLGVNVQYPWEDLPRRHHDHAMEVKSFHIDRYPVTNAQFARFMTASRYQPADRYNFLKDWVDGAPRPGWANKPVTWVSLDDARAYATWAGKRLPREWEWQYAAQGTDDRAYPWGNNADDRAVPEFQDGRDLPGPDDVDAHPAGSSPFGVMDMVGNVWQWTDEFQDLHTRSAIVRGGSYYRPKGSIWYFPQNRKLGEHGKLLLMAPGKDRAGTVGFRCVVDAD